MCQAVRFLSPAEAGGSGAGFFCDCTLYTERIRSEIRTTPKLGGCVTACHRLLSLSASGGEQWGKGQSPLVSGAVQPGRGRVELIKTKGFPVHEEHFKSSLSWPESSQAW